jgi:hypothetical protein
VEVDLREKTWGSIVGSPHTGTRFAVQYVAPDARLRNPGERPDWCQWLELMNRPNNLTVVKSIKCLPKHMAATYRCLRYLPVLRSSKSVLEPRETYHPERLTIGGSRGDSSADCPCLGNCAASHDGRKRGYSKQYSLITRTEYLFWGTWKSKNLLA